MPTFIVILLQNDKKKKNIYMTLIYKKDCFSEEQNPCMLCIMQKCNMSNRLLTLNDT